MDLLKKYEENKKKLATLDPKSQEAQELQQWIDNCEDYLKEHGE